MIKEGKTMENEELNNFLKENRISDEIWENSKCDWDELIKIKTDFINHHETLSNLAVFYTNLLQKIKDIHSVRWRIKDPDHLIEKIIRKKAEGKEKYQNISVDNYQSIVTDLIGIRALHLFKEDCFSIDREIRKLLSLATIEEPVAYIREGDPRELRDKYANNNFKVMNHPAGYRSIHYVIASKPAKVEYYAEIQVRTIFEEGWSEIDHRVRYPNFSDDKLVVYFLDIFNRMAGSADEMGSFVTILLSSIKESNDKLENSFVKIESLLTQLDELKEESSESNNTINQLKQEVNKLKKESNPLGIQNNLFDEWIKLQKSLDNLKKLRI